MQTNEKHGIISATLQPRRNQKNWGGNLPPVAVTSPRKSARRRDGRNGSPDDRKRARPEISPSAPRSAP